MIFSTIGLILIIYSFRNFKKAFLWLLVFKLFLVTNITVVAIPGIPILKWNMLLIAFFLFQYWRKKDALRVENIPFPYEKPFKFLILSWFLSTIFAYIGFMEAVSQFIGTVFEDLIIVWLMWKLIDVRKDLPFIIKWFSIAFFCISLYGFYEHQFQANPLVEYEASIVDDEDRAVVFTYDADAGRGYRVQSVFEHAIGAGINWVLYLIFVFSLWINYQYKLNNKMFVFISALLGIPCIFFTNSRGPILFLMIAVFSVINLKNRRIIYFLATCLIVGIFIAPMLGDYAANVISIFDNKAQEQVGGSNADMRFEQLAAAIALMQQSPLFGFGFKFLNEMNNALTSALLGMESMWFRILTQFGMLGVIANIYYAYYSLYLIPRYFKSKTVFFLSLAYWVVASVSSVPGILMYMYYLIIIIFIKLSPKYNKERSYVYQ